MASLTQWNELEQALGDSGGQDSLACCSPWGHKESDTTEQLKTTVTIVGMWHMYGYAQYTYYNPRPWGRVSAINPAFRAHVTVLNFIFA